METTVRFEFWLQLWKGSAMRAAVAALGVVGVALAAWAGASRALFVAPTTVRAAPPPARRGPQWPFS